MKTIEEIDEAIKILEEYSTGRPQPSPKGMYDAVKLSIEALKRVKDEKHLILHPGRLLLEEATTKAQEAYYEAITKARASAWKAYEKAIRKAKKACYEAIEEDKQSEKEI